MSENSNKQEIFLGLGVSEYEHDQIGPIFSDEDDAKKWVEKCKKLSKERAKELEKEGGYDKHYSKIYEKYKKLFKKIDGDMYADDYNYIKKTIDIIKI